MEQLKYTIRRRLDKMTKAEHQRTMKKLLKALQPVARNTFYRWMNTPISSSFEIPYTSQQSIAEIFGLSSVDELATPTKKPAHANA